MAMKENFISMAPDEESNAKVTPIDNNKTLMIDQYTSNVEPGNPELVDDIWTINDAFAHFKPSVEVDFIEEEGGSVNETLPKWFKLPLAECRPLLISRNGT